MVADTREVPLFRRVRRGRRLDALTPPLLSPPAPFLLSHGKHGKHGPPPPPQLPRKCVFPLLLLGDRG